MPVNYETPNLTFGLLPEPSGRSASFLTSAIVNVSILCALIALGMLIKPKLVEHTFEQTTLVLPNTPPPPPKIKLTPPKLPPPPKIREVKLDAPKIQLPKLEPKPEKPIQMEAKLNTPVIKAPKSAVVLAPQPKAALAAAAPAQVPQAKPSTAPVHVGQLFGVTPNPNATRPAQVAAIGNPYGGMSGPAVAPRGVVGSTGFGNGTKSGSSSGVVGKVASAGIPGNNTATPTPNMGRVASAGIPAMTAAAVTPTKVVAGPPDTAVEVLSKPQPQYTSDAKLAKVQGDVVLRVTFTANGQVVVQSVVKGLGHGLDEEARRVTERIRFRPATHNGKPVDSTNNIRISFQLA